MSDMDSTQPVLDSTTGEECTTFENVLELLSAHFTCDDSSPRHARLSVELSEGAQPVMVYLGSSSLETSREVVNIASPLLGVSVDNIYDIVASMDTMPLGALRRLGGILHIHEVLAFGEFTGEILISCIRLVAAQALSLRSSHSDGERDGDDENEGEQ